MQRLRFLSKKRKKMRWVVATTAAVVLVCCMQQYLKGTNIVFSTRDFQWASYGFTGGYNTTHRLSTFPSSSARETRVARYGGWPVSEVQTIGEQTLAPGLTRNSLTTSGQTKTFTTQHPRQETVLGILPFIDKHVDKATLDQNSESNFQLISSRRQNSSSERDNTQTAVVSLNERSIPRAASESRVGGLVNAAEVTHVFFLKVHKAASTTVMNIIYRFALSRNLTVMLPRRSNSFSQVSKYWRANTMPRPPGVQHFDILCNHVVFSPELVKKNLPADARYLAIVRHPLQQTISAFHYYRSVYPLPYLAAVPGDDPLGMYLADPLRWEPRKASISFTMNRMSFDFGLDPHSFDDGEYLEAALQYLSRTFDLVMVSERFDESVVLMKRLLGWGWKDILYTRNNALPGKQNGTHDVTEDEKRNHRLHNAADYALYEHFSTVFDKRVVAMGNDFTQEVASFRTALLTVEAFCKSRVQADLEVGKSTWDPGFVVGRAECAYMQMPEMEFVELVRRRQASKFRAHFRSRKSFVLDGF